MRCGVGGCLFTEPIRENQNTDMKLSNRRTDFMLLFWLVGLVSTQHWILYFVQ